MSARPMKIFFSMRHSGALRNYSSTLEELAVRGHRIHLAFMMRDKLADPRLLEALTGRYPHITHGAAEVSRRAWLGMARATRSTADYLRYRTPEYRDAAALYERAAARVSPAVQALSRFPVVRTRAGLTFVANRLRSIERAIPPDPAIVGLIASHSPDLVLVTPLIELGSDQVEYIKAARALGIPCGLCVHSWDNLTNKGLIHAVPERVFVWNEAQRKEAVDLHAIPDANVVVTGAPTYDQWFTRRPSTTREEFCRKVGLPAERPFFLYLCSSKFIAPREADYVKRWIQALRAATDPRVRAAAVLVRPHPRGDMRGLDGPELHGPNDVAVWPREGANPVDTDSRNDYFDSLYHSVAAVGINTSAQIEAGIVGRPVYSIRAAEYVATQEGTLHFHYLLNENGGLLHMSPTLEEHARALSTALDRTPEDERRLREFVRGFVRPRGLDVAATPLLADAIEDLGRLSAQARERVSLGSRLLRMVLHPVAARMKTERPVRRPRAASSAVERKARRFLFVMHYPGYLRYFDSAIRLLAARGHHIDLVFDNPAKQSEGTEAISDMAGSVEVLGRMPTRDDIWAIVAHDVRGTMDYGRYLHPDFADTPYLRDRMQTALPNILGFLTDRKTRSAQFVQRLTRFLATCERAIPSSSVIEELIRSRKPDAVLVTPLVTDCSRQVDVVKSAHALGIPAALCVASWDHLTTKGLIRVQPDLVSVWNEEQKKEALAYHDIPASSLVVTGAQPFDRWFERTPTARQAFCAKVGLPADRPFVLFVGSTASISAPDAELTFVRRWITALRSHPFLAEVSILVRPHPFNSRHWSDADVGDLPSVAVYPHWANPVNESDRQDYFDSLYHSGAVVGINTTAMIEAAIVGRTVHSVLADEFKDTQGGTLHFRYLLSENGGFLRVADNLAEHAAQVAETLATPEIGRDSCARFVRAFVRPHGLDVQTTPILVDALERLATKRRARARVSVLLYPLSAVLWVSGMLSMLSNSPQRVWNLARKQWRIAGKKTYNARKRLRRVQSTRADDGREGTDMPRRKVG